MQTGRLLLGGVGSGGGRGGTTGRDVDDTLGVVLYEYTEGCRAGLGCIAWARHCQHLCDWQSRDGGWHRQCGKGGAAARTPRVGVAPASRVVIHGCGDGDSEWPLPDVWPAGAVGAADPHLLRVRRAAQRRPHPAPHWEQGRGPPLADAKLSRAPTIFRQHYVMKIGKVLGKGYLSNFQAHLVVRVSTPLRHRP